MVFFCKQQDNLADTKSFRVREKLIALPRRNRVFRKSLFGRDPLTHTPRRAPSSAAYVENEAVCHEGRSGT